MTIFCQILKIIFFFLHILIYPPPIAVRNSLTNQFDQKSWRLSIFSIKKKVTSFSWTLLDISVLHFFFIYRNIIFLGKNNWSLNSGRRWGGDSKGYKKKLFSKLDKHFVTIFWWVLKRKIIFFYIPSYPRPSPSGIHRPINFTKKNWRFCIFSTTTKKWQV